VQEKPAEKSGSKPAERGKEAPEANEEDTAQLTPKVVEDIVLRTIRRELKLRGLGGPEDDVKDSPAPQDPPKK
jgi:hypothetical protein